MRQDIETVEEKHLQHEINRIRQIEDSIKVKPTNKDIKETVALFMDFEVNIDISEIPDFKNVAALHRWRISVISNSLGDK